MIVIVFFKQNHIHILLTSGFAILLSWVKHIVKCAVFDRKPKSCTSQWIDGINDWRHLPKKLLPSKEQYHHVMASSTQRYKCNICQQDFFNPGNHHNLVILLVSDDNSW